MKPEANVPTFVIEREISDVGNSSPDHLRHIAEKSNGVLRKLSRGGDNVQWVQSFVAGDKVYCIYRAPHEQAVRDHARISGFPANRIELIFHIIDPTTAE